MEELISTRETARRLGVTPETLLRWVRLGKVPACRVGDRLFRFVPEDVERFIRATRALGSSVVGNTAA